MPTGVILSGAKLVDNLDYRESLRRWFEAEAIGGKMEAAGVYVAAFEQGVDWLVVKGICDFADGQKGKNKARRQKLAAKNAATVVRLALEGPGLFPERAHEPAARRPAPAGGECCPWPSTGDMGMRDLKTIEERLEKHPRARRTSLHKDRPEELEREQGEEVDVLEHLLAWAREPGAPPLFALLGEYGMGKTITCQRLACRIEALRQEDPTLPIPLYFDLRHVTGLKEGVPTLRETVAQCVARGWRDEHHDFDHAQLLRLVDQGALVIFDGLDEVLVHLSEADGQAFTRHLLTLHGDAMARRAAGGPAPAPRLLVSCRTQYFRTLRDQKTHFTGQERGGPGPEVFRALLLLPFDEEADPARLVETIQAVHNLEELARRPYTLKLVAEFIPEIEAARARGETVRGVSLYRRTALSWLDRDQGKHHLKPEHKLRLVAHLAAEMARAGQALLPAPRLESWFHRWLAEQDDLRFRYDRMDRDQLEEDLRTAAFLKRVDGTGETDGGFRFAHTSLYEFFLASHLLEALRADRPERWALPLPSPETLDFLGQLLDEAGGTDLLTTLQGWRRQYRPQASDLLLAYALRARARGWPLPILHGMDLRGARLQGWHIGEPGGAPLELGPARMSGADLRQARMYGVKAAGADLTNARLDQAEWHGCALAGARFAGAQAPGALLRRCDLAGSNWEKAAAWRAPSPPAPSRGIPPIPPHQPDLCPCLLHRFGHIPLPPRVTPPPAVEGMRATRWMARTCREMSWSVVP